MLRLPWWWLALSVSVDMQIKTITMGHRMYRLCRQRNFIPSVEK
jgi:hypothetical protein